MIYYGRCLPKSGSVSPRAISLSVTDVTPKSQFVQDNLACALVCTDDLALVAPRDDCNLCWCDAFVDHQALHSHKIY